MKMKFRARRSVYVIAVSSLFITISIITYQNYVTHFVEFQADTINVMQQDSLEYLEYVNSYKLAKEDLLKIVPQLPSTKVLSQLHSDDSIIWPDANQPWDDRINKQMYYVPSTYRPTDKILQILRPGGLGTDPSGQDMFLMEECPVNRCSLTADLNERLTADAVVFQNDYITYTPVRGPNQIWILWVIESPVNSFVMTPLANQLNWTATYRTDSTIVAPYAKFMHFDNFTGKLNSQPQKDYFKGKTKAVAWFVSNCNSANKRFQYAIELQKYIHLDIYGACGTFECPRYKEQKCFEKLRREYLFYLSFENSNCKYYITEKFFQNALEHEVVPVVMGGRKEDYYTLAPPGSFIHVEDFDSVRELANYLHKLSEDRELYNQYFRWKGTGSFINTKFWCRVCAMLHAVIGSGVKSRRGGGGVRHKRGGALVKRWYRDVEEWWRNNQTCTKGSWDDPDEMISRQDWNGMIGIW